MSAGTPEGLWEEQAEHENHEAWVIPYADMLTLLMALFMMLFAISRVDLVKFEQLKVGLSDSLGGSGILEGGDAAVVESPPTSRPQAVAQSAGTGTGTGTHDPVQVLLLDRITAALAGLGRQAQVEAEPRGVVITLPADEVLFAPGSWQLAPQGAALVAELGRSLAASDGMVVVEGHTDDVPYAPSSNWELSALRATGVLRHLQDAGVTADRLSAVGHADTVPVASNTTPTGRAANRRVEVVLVSAAAVEAGDQPPGSSPATAPAAAQGSFGLDLVGDAFRQATGTDDGSTADTPGTGR